MKTHLLRPLLGLTGLVPPYPALTGWAVAALPTSVGVNHLSAKIVCSGQEGLGLPQPGHQWAAGTRGARQ